MRFVRRWLSKSADGLSALAIDDYSKGKFDLAANELEAAGRMSGAGRRTAIQALMLGECYLRLGRRESALHVMKEGFEAFARETALGIAPTAFVLESLNAYALLLDENGDRARALEIRAAIGR